MEKLIKQTDHFIANGLNEKIPFRKSIQVMQLISIPMRPFPSKDNFNELFLEII